MYYIIDRWKEESGDEVESIEELSTHDEDIAHLTAYARWVGMLIREAKKRTSFELIETSEFYRDTDGTAYQLIHKYK
jgi:septation ring formation regulator EzrA